jgi:hypothetical protein
MPITFFRIHAGGYYSTRLLGILLIILSLPISIIAQEKTVRPDELACPVTANLSPDQSRFGNSFSFVFPDGSILRRISMALTHPEGKDIAVRFTWVPAKDPHVPLANWGESRGILLANGIGRTDCFFLGWEETDIPENVPCKEFVLDVPEGVLVREVSFSSLPSEKPQVLCPMPELEREIEQAYSDCQANPQDKGKSLLLIQLLEKATPRYDCRRSYDSQPVPAWWLANHEAPWRWVNYLLARIRKDDGDALRAYQKFLASSDGVYAEEWREDMRQVLGNKPLLVLENWTGSEENRVAVGMAGPFPSQGDSHIDNIIGIYRDIALKEARYKSACEQIISILSKKEPSSRWGEA